MESAKLKKCSTNSCWSEDFFLSAWIYPSRQWLELVWVMTRKASKQKRMIQRLMILDGGDALQSEMRITKDYRRSARRWLSILLPIWTWESQGSISRISVTVVSRYQSGTGAGILSWSSKQISNRRLLHSEAWQYQRLFKLLYFSTPLECFVLWSLLKIAGLYMSTLPELSFSSAFNSFAWPDDCFLKSMSLLSLQQDFTEDLVCWASGLETHLKIVGRSG